MYKSGRDIQVQISQWETLLQHGAERPCGDEPECGRAGSGRSGRTDQPWPSRPAAAGMPVKKGQLLAYLHPLVSAGERSSQQAELAELKVKAAQAARQLARLQALSATVVAARELEAQRAELDALRASVPACWAAGGVTQALRAPPRHPGQANAINGQQFDAGGAA